MDDRTKTVAATGIIVGFFLIVLIIIIVMLTGKKVLSPVPEEKAIKIIFLTPTPASGTVSTPSANQTSAVTGTVTPKSR